MSSQEDLYLAKPLLPFSIRSVTDPSTPSDNSSTSSGFCSTTKNPRSPQFETTAGNGGNAPNENDIPRSVRGAPRHLRAVIRKRQNSESAKRSRQRKSNQRRELAAMFEEQVKRIYALEDRVTELVRLIAEVERQEVFKEGKAMGEEMGEDLKEMDRAGEGEEVGSRAGESEEAEASHRDIIRLLDVYIERAAGKYARVRGMGEGSVEEGNRVPEG